MHQFCDSYFYVIGIGTACLILLTEISMQLRVYALYDCSKRILFINGTLFALEIVGIATLLALDYLMYNDCEAELMSMHLDGLRSN